MRHLIYADDVENEVSEENRNPGIGERPPAAFEHEVEDTQPESAPSPHTPATEPPLGLPVSASEDKREGMVVGGRPKGGDRLRGIG